MDEEDRKAQGRLRRLVEAIEDEGFPGVDPTRWTPLLVAELDYAMHPRVHERRIPTYGAFVAPTRPALQWQEASALTVSRRDLPAGALVKGRRFADGVSTWLVRGAPDSSEDPELLVFDRPAGSERDLVVLAGISGATIVQRDGAGVVRVVSAVGVLRWDGLGWHHEPPISSWIDLDDGFAPSEDPVLEKLLEFAVHDLGARGIGSILLFDPGDDEVGLSRRMPTPPPLRIDRPADLAPLRHVLGQVDGAAVFDGDGVLRQLGSRIVPSSNAEAALDSYRGMRHTAARLFSYDDPAATVVVVSEDGPVTVWRRGGLLGRSETFGSQPEDD